MSEERAPYEIWAVDCPYRKTGSPVVGNMGTHIKRVVIIDAETFARLLRENPSLATAQFNVGEFT